MPESRARPPPPAICTAFEEPVRIAGGALVGRRELLAPKAQGSARRATVTGKAAENAARPPGRPLRA